MSFSWLLISDLDSNKVQLHSDAKRLFSDSQEDKGTKGEWETYYDPQNYRSRKQAFRHSERDGTAFATVALPAHYSAILSIFDHIKRRLEPSWRVERIIDWGAGTGSGLWFDYSDHHRNYSLLTSPAGQLFMLSKSQLARLMSKICKSPIPLS